MGSLTFNIVEERVIFFALRDCGIKILRWGFSEGTGSVWVVCRFYDLESTGPFILESVHFKFGLWIKIFH